MQIIYSYDFGGYTKLVLSFIFFLKKIFFRQKFCSFFRNNQQIIGHDPDE